MAKDTYYFSHDYNARNDEKILELRVKYGAEGYGLFWMLVETMAENENGGAKASLIGGLSLGYGVAKEKLVEFIDYCVSIELFFEEDGFIFSRRMKKHKDFRLTLSEKGKEGAKKRWGSDSPPIATPMQRKGKERKGKEIFNTMPVVSDFNGLPEVKAGSAIQLLKITKQVDVSNEDVKGLWEVFKEQSLTGKKYYQDEDAVYSHFINWVKDKKFTAKQIIIDNDGKKRLSPNAFV